MQNFVINKGVLRAIELLEKRYLKTDDALELGKLYEKQNKFGLAYQHYLKAFSSKNFEG